MAHLKADLFKTHEHQKNTGSIWFESPLLCKTGTWKLNWSGTDRVETKATHIYWILAQWKKKNQGWRLVGEKETKQGVDTKSRGVYFGCNIFALQNVMKLHAFHERQLWWLRCADPPLFPFSCRDCGHSGERWLWIREKTSGFFRAGDALSALFHLIQL